jgi:hypothetical protein
MKILLSCGLLFTAFARIFYGQATIGNCPVFPANNIWNTPIDKLPVAANSATLVNTIGASKGFHPDFGAGQWYGVDMGIPFILVNGSQPKLPVTFTYPDEADPGPYAIPLNAPIEGGADATGDRHAIAIDTTNCILYELYRAFPLSSSWQADSGAIFNLRSNALRPYGWTSVDAAGLPLMPGLVTYEEVAAGEIKHALRFSVPQTKREFVWPARHYASQLTGTQYPRMGERFRLRANYDISTFSPEIQVILKAMKKYGIILADNGGTWYLQGKGDDRWNNDTIQEIRRVLGSDMEAVDATVLMVDRDSGEAKQPGIQVNVTPATASLYVGRNQQFTATVSGTTNNAVVWSVDGVVGGSATRGFISTTGLYMAPTALPSPPTIVIKAVTVAIPSASDTSAVTVTPLPSITSASPNPITTTSFTLTATGVGFRVGAIIRFNGTNLATTWLSSTQVRGTGTASVSAASVPVVVTNPDGVASNTAYVQVQLPATTTITVVLSPASITMKISNQKQFVATVSGTTNTAVTWKVNGIVGGNSTVGTITAGGLYIAPKTVPTTGLSVVVSATSSANTTKVGNANVRILLS